MAVPLSHLQVVTAIQTDSSYCAHVLGSQICSDTQLRAIEHKKDLLCFNLVSTVVSVSTIAVIIFSPFAP
jgi:hypothetical protein